jgi:hypothetical protein
MKTKISPIRISGIQHYKRTVYRYEHKEIERERERGEREREISNSLMMYLPQAPRKRRTNQTKN